VKGPDNGTPVSYGLTGLASASTAVVSSAGMDGVDGAWPILAGSTPFTASELKLFAEEDQIVDTERRHTTEQMAYLVFGQLGSPLRGSVMGDGAGDTTGVLTQQQAEAMTTQALASWAVELGVDQLPSVDVSVADLPGDLLGVASGSSITLDIDGAGVGWFIDQTPEDDDEFSAGLATADADSPAAGKYDLLSAISHEIGHTLGLDHGATDQVMADTLQPGERLQHSSSSLDLIGEDLLDDLAEDISGAWGV
jgi:hypothetical protein